MSKQHYEQLPNDKRTVRCFQIRTRKHKINPNGLAPGEVDNLTLAKEIEAGCRYFWNRRPGVHRSFFNFEFSSNRRATA